MPWRVLIAVMLALPVLGACMTPRGANPAEKRNQVRQMRDETLADFYRAHPGLRTRVAGAAGYGVFSNLSMKILTFGTGQGYGMVVDHATGRETYMRMAQLAAGVGMGVEDFRVLFLFETPSTLRRFVEEGWQVSGDADAGAAYQGEGATVGTQAVVTQGDVGAGLGSQLGGDTQDSLGYGIEVYQMTRSGIAAKAMVGGTKYWKDAELN